MNNTSVRKGCFTVCQINAFVFSQQKLHRQRSTLETRQAGRAVSMFEWLAPPMWEVVPKGDVGAIPSELLGLWETIKRL